MTAYVPSDKWNNVKVAARLRLERMRFEAKVRSERGLGLTPTEANSFNTSDRWVRRFIGFSERRFCPEGQGTTDLAIRAGRMLFDLGHHPSDIDWIIFGSVTPSYLYSPPDSTLLQDQLGIPVWLGGEPRETMGVDVSLACSTWVASLMLCYALIRAGMARRIILIGADRMSATINWRDRSFATVLGDAGTATLCAAVPAEEDWFSPEQFWGWLNGEKSEIIRTPMGGSKQPLRSSQDVDSGQHYLSMDGRAVREVIVPFIGGPAMDAALAKAGWSMDQLDMLTLHEANLVLNDSIVKMWRQRGFRGEVVSAQGRFGNTTSASIPLAWSLNPKALAVGRNFGLIGFGGGLSAAFAFGTIKHPIQILANE